MVVFAPLKGRYIRRQAPSCQRGRRVPFAARTNWTTGSPTSCVRRISQHPYGFTATTRLLTLLRRDAITARVLSRALRERVVAAGTRRGQCRADARTRIRRGEVYVG